MRVSNILFYMVNHPKQVIYNLLEWGAGGDGGRRGLIMIGLSNTVDLPERVMQVGQN